jgi:hypothetical protein
LAFGIHTIAFAMLADRFVGNAELPLTKQERYRLLSSRPSVRERIFGVCFCTACCVYGIYNLIH